jgi:hypothetical protein
MDIKNAQNNSPWLYKFGRTRDVVQIASDGKADIVIVGGGIAGMLTAYQILTSTEKSVILVDSHRVGHGASGHNAGQLTTYFERPLADIALEYGIEKTCEAQRGVEEGWKTLEEIQKKVQLQTPVYTFTGYAGLSEVKQVLGYLTDNMIRYTGRLPLERMLIADTCPFLVDIPDVYKHLYEIVPQTTILKILQTKNTEYIAALAYKKGATNSARICEELAVFLLKHFSERFSLYEDSPVNKIVLYENDVRLEILKDKKDTVPSDTGLFDTVIEAKDVVLCTNGFKGFNIINTYGRDIHEKFSKDITGLVNYMSAYVDEGLEKPVATSYFPKEPVAGEEESTLGDSYFYITRRPHFDKDTELNLVSIGGPERLLGEGEIYSRSSSPEIWAEESIKTFLQKNYAPYGSDSKEHQFAWHGLLGFTKNGLRLVGRDPYNPRLLYNLGCNGIGIMPSVYGSKRICDILSGKSVTESIFDPKAL